MPRDNFYARVIETSARRVNYLCSHPDCRALTSGPHSDAGKAVNVGETAQITAASPGEPRHNPSLTPSQRSAAENGIWPCQTHARMLDTDEKLYPAEMLRELQRKAEEPASEVIERPGTRIPSFDGLFRNLPPQVARFAGRDVDIEDEVTHLTADNLLAVSREIGDRRVEAITSWTRSRQYEVTDELR